MPMDISKLAHIRSLPRRKSKIFTLTVSRFPCNQHQAFKSVALANSRSRPHPSISAVLSASFPGALAETRDYSMLAPYTESGASIDVEVAGNLDMVTSTIASMYGGNVTVNSVNGGINLGSQDTFTDSRFAFGIYTSGHSDVSVTAAGDINIESSRIAAYNGGNIFVESSYGDVNVGSGGNAYVLVPLVFRNPATGLGYSPT